MRRALFGLALLLLLPAISHAQPGRFELTPMAGYRLQSDFDTHDDVFGSRVDVDESAAYGLFFDIPVFPNWKLEILANRQQTQFVTDRGLFTHTDVLGDVDLTTVQAGFLFQWGEGQVDPFFGFAAGLTRIDPKFDGLSSDDRFSVSFGGGVKFFFDRNVGLRLEGRGYWTDLETGFDDHGHHGHDHSDDGLLQWEGSVGLIIAF